MRWRTRRLPSCHQPCVSPVSSRTLAASVKKIWQETVKPSGARKTSSSGARKSGATRMSLFNSTTMSFLAARKPAFDPPPKPRFCGSARIVTSGKVARRKSALPSVEPLSTTRISFAGLPASAVGMRGMYFSSRSFPFQLGSTTVAARGMVGRTPSSARDPLVALFRTRTPAARSVSSSARKLIAMRNGESNNSGSARMRRFKKAMSERGTDAYFAPKFDPSGSAHHIKLIFELAFLLLQAERPRRSLLQFFFRLLQGGARRRQRIGDFTDFAGQAGFNVESPLGFFAALLLQGRNLGVISGNHCARIFLIARQLFLKFVDARAACGESGVQLFRPSIAAFQFFLLLLVFAVKFREIELRFVEPLVLGGEFAFELGDMALAFSQHVGHARHVKKGRVADLRPVGAHRDEEVALIGDRLCRIPAGLHRVSRLGRP